MRIACLLIPDLVLVAELRAHPELAGQPLAIVAGSGPRAEVLAASPEATRAGVRLGCSVAHARTACAELYVRSASPAKDRSARSALLDVALSFSPRAVLAKRGSGPYAAEAAVYLDASGITALFHSERGFAAAITERSRRLGLPAVLSVASSRAAAHLAARGRMHAPGTVSIVPPAAEKRFLARLPIDLIDADPGLASGLTRFGVQTLGDLARLPRRAAAARLGPEVLRLADLALGKASEPPFSTAAERHFEEAVDLEAPIDRLEPLAFALRGLLSRLADRLSARGLACGDLDLALGLSGGGRDVRRIGSAAPTLDSVIWVRLVCLALEARPPEGAIETIAIATEGLPGRTDQLDLFRPAGPAPAVLSRTLAELEALCGARRVGTPAVSDDHRPDAFALTEFDPRGDASKPGGLGDTPRRLAVRALRPPVPASVRMARELPESLRSGVANGRIVKLAGPWRTTGRWWSKQERFAFDYFDVETSDGTLARLRLDRIRRRWHIDAVYD
jgi:protein ImuB